MNMISAKALLAAYLAQDIPAWLWGPSGIGKSSLPLQLAKEAGVGFVDLRANLLDPVDFRGLPFVTGRVVDWATPGFLPNIERDGPRGYLLLDEFNTAPVSVMNAGLGLILDRKLGDYRLPPGWTPIAAGNRQSDRAAVNRLPTPLAKRFAHIDIEPELSAFVAHAIDMGVAPVVVAFLRFRPELLHKMPDGAELASPDPRNWFKVAKLVSLPDAIREPAISGIIGPAAAREFEGFVRIWQTLPPIADIIADPDRAPVPREFATLWAISAALGRKADRANFAAILRYGARLPREFGIICALDGVRRDATLKTTQAFVAWAQANQDVTL